jgi:hypothetical protein
MHLETICPETFGVIFEQNFPLKVEERKNDHRDPRPFIYFLFFDIFIENLYGQRAS